MKKTWIALCIAALVAGFALGRATQPRVAASDDSFAEALQELDPLLRAQRISAALQHFGPDQVAEATTALERWSVGVTPEEVRWLMLAWARFDAAGAFAWARDYPGPWRSELMDQAAYAWGYHHGADAFAPLQEISDPEQAQWLRPSVMQGWLRSGDGERAAAYVATVPDADRRRRLTFTLAGEMLRRGVEPLIEWTEAIPEDAPNGFKQNAFYHAATMVASEAPERAASWFERHQRDWYSEGSLPGIARRWAERHDARALYEWLLGLTPDPEREDERREAIASSFRVWMQSAPADAVAWLEERWSEPDLAPAVVEAARGVAVSEPATAIAWAERIEDPKVRERVLVRAARRWWRSDPEAAGRWLEASALSETLQQKIRSRQADEIQSPS